MAKIKHRDSYDQEVWEDALKKDALTLRAYVRGAPTDDNVKQLAKLLKSFQDRVTKESDEYTQEDLNYVVNFQDNDGLTALHAACEQHNDKVAEICQLLLDNCADINSQTKSGATPLCMLLKHNAIKFEKFNEKLRGKPSEAKEFRKQNLFNVASVLIKNKLRTQQE